MYEITIKEIKTVTKLVRGEHTVIDERPYTDAEIANANAPFRATYESVDPKQVKKVYGYAPDREEEREVSREILTQAVEDLDLARVIRAINNL